MHMFPEPYFLKEAYKNNLKEIKTSGFYVDPFLSERLLPQTLGYNITMAWPFPKSIRTAYEHLRERLLSLDRILYVYPAEETHITVATPCVLQTLLAQHARNHEYQETDNPCKYSRA